MKWQLILIPLAILALLSGLLFGASQQTDFPSGQTIAMVPVGGLSANEAESKLDLKIKKPLLKRSIALDISGGQTNKTDEVKISDLKINLPISGAVARASEREGSFITRGLRQIFGYQNNTPVVATANRRAIKSEAKKIKDDLTLAPHNAQLVLTPQGPKISSSRDGQRPIGGQKLIEKSLRAALLTSTAKIEIEKTSPQITAKDLNQSLALIVSKKTRTVRLYRGKDIIRTYGVAIGQPAYPTPRGLFAINGKQVNPVWSVPNSAWAGEMAGQVVSGGSAENPLVARWMGVVDGVGFHGTRDVETIGTAASHGCLRMRPDDIIKLYPLVREGTPVLIYG